MPVCEDREMTLVVSVNEKHLIRKDANVDSRKPSV